MSSKLSRRDFFRVVKNIGVTTFVSFASTYYAMEFEPGWLDVSQVELRLKGLPKAFDGFRILQLSDIHIGGWMNRDRLAYVVETALAQAPDLVLTTGDYVIGHVWSAEIALSALDFIDVMKPLAQRQPVIGVLGNHDHWTDAARARDMLKQAGIIELENDVQRISRNNENLYIAGLDDVSEGKHRLEELEAKLPYNAPAILLVHEPDVSEQTAITGKFLLQLSGHSHGGQVVIPFYGPPVLPRWGRRYPAGLYQLGEMLLYTNRGVGMTSPFVRINCRPEIAVFTLRSV